MNDADRLEAMEILCRDLMDRNKVLWERVARAQFHEDNYLWLRDIWWRNCKPSLSQYDSSELDGVIAALRQGREPPASRRSQQFDEWHEVEERGRDVG